MARKDTQFVYCQEEIIYGPVSSRRLNKSIGINLFPGSSKVCSFDCIYCFLRVRSTQDLPHNIVSPNDVAKALEKYFRDPANNHLLREEIYLTFSGNGEPTLHPDFLTIVQAVLGWQKANAPKARLAIFTNGTTLSKTDTRKGLFLFHNVFVKLDWGNQNELDSLARPHQPILFESFVEDLKQFTVLARQETPRPKVIIQTAAWPDANRGRESWSRWADAVVKVKPDDVHIYELDFKGQDYFPPYRYDFLDLKRTVRKLLRTKRTVTFYTTNTFYSPVDLCLAVDSLIYLPLYIADYAQLFAEKQISINHFVSADGDLGAVEAIRNGEAQFAICDPQAALDHLSASKDSEIYRDEPVLVAVLIDKLALWILATANGVSTPREALTTAGLVVTYQEGSTAHHVLNWQRKARGATHLNQQVRYVKPGEELKSICHERNPKSINCAVITADLLGALHCSTNCKEEISSFVPYSGRPPLKRFLFAGLLASRDFIRSHPREVDGVVEALAEAIKKTRDVRFMEKHRKELIDYLVTLYSNKRPWYLDECAQNQTALTGSIDQAIELLTSSNLYAPKGYLSFRAFYNALKIRRFATNSKNPTWRALVRWVDRRAASLPKRMLVGLASGLARLTGFGTASMFLVGMVLALLAVVTGVWSYRADAGSINGIAGGTLAAVLTSLSAASFFSCALGISGKRSKQL